VQSDEGTLARAAAVVAIQGRPWATGRKVNGGQRFVNPRHLLRQCFRRPVRERTQHTEAAWPVREPSFVWNQLWHQEILLKCRSV